MSSISIKKPIALNMDVVEIDEHLPSIKMIVELNIEHPTGKIFYQANDIWFDCSEWDDSALALKQLSGSNNSKACLENLSDNFIIVFTKDNNIIKLDLPFWKITVAKGLRLLSSLQQLVMIYLFQLKISLLNLKSGGRLGSVPAERRWRRVLRTTCGANPAAY